jgi:uncharacterized Zn finger protein
MWYDFRPYVPVAERRRKAAREMEKLKRKGHAVSPVVIDGRTIARTFWGKSWCDNLERYSDFSNRLPRGRTYVRNGSIVDLQVAPGEVKALVSGSSIYKVAVKVSAVPEAHWHSICADCAGAIDSLVELLQGRFSKGVMERICHPKTGLFPAPAEIKFSCSCPDWASMCKHVAAVLYGIGARLDAQPELVFLLRDVDHQDLIAKAGSGVCLSKKGPSTERVLAGEGLSELFGLDMADSETELIGAVPSLVPAQRRRTSRAPTKSQPGSRKVETRRARPASSKTKAASHKARARSRAKR